MEQMSAAQRSLPKLKRRWGQFGLRTLFVLMTLAAICLGLFAYRLERARRQAAAVGKFQRVAGGMIGYRVGGNTAFVDDPSIAAYINDGTSSTINFAQVSHSRPLYMPEWLERRLGIDFFGDVIEVTSGHYLGGDEDLADLQSFPRLERVDFMCAPRVTDEALPHLTKLRHLKYVRLGGANISADGIARLQESLPNCEVVPSDLQ
jgi:hypothetical protein